ncbi:MAG TPA: hypothetical protein VG435_12615 [Acidimicrobiales bacterium]|nr:hypothetical protein [Acidimicrobiales bacterium]
MVTADGQIAVAVRGAHPGLVLLADTDPRQVRFVALAGDARHLALDGPDGPILVPEESTDQLVEVSVPGARVERTVAVGHQPHDAAAVGDGIAVGNEFGNSVDLIRPGFAPKVVAAPLQPGGVAADADGFVVVGVRARVIAAYTAAGVLVAQADCGTGPTHVVAGADGYFYVADTDGGALLVFRLRGDHLDQVGSIAVGSHPYGLAADLNAGWVYVTLTGSNQVVGLRLDGARVDQRMVWPTGRQPNSVAVDEHRSLLVVTATGADQIEFIPLG